MERNLSNSAVTSGGMWNCGFGTGVAILAPTTHLVLQPGEPLLRRNHFGSERIARVKNSVFCDVPAQVAWTFPNGCDVGSLSLLCNSQSAVRRKDHCNCTFFVGSLLVCASSDEHALTVPSHPCLQFFTLRAPQLEAHDILFCKEGRLGGRSSFFFKTKGNEKSSQQKSNTLAQVLTRAQHTGTRRPLHERGDPHHPRHVDV